MWLRWRFTLQRNEHVRIDFISVKMPVRVQHLVSVVLYVMLLLPAIYILTATAVSEAWDAYVTGQVERVSPWSPVIWPYYLGLAAGLTALFLQIIAEVIRHVIKAVTPDTSTTPASVVCS